MELQGKVIVVLPERSGVSARGEWKSQSYVIETHEQYPKQMVFDVFGADRIAQFAIHSGDEITVSFDITAHEYNGRWFNNIRAWNVQHVDPNSVQGVPPVGSDMPFSAAQQAAPIAQTITNAAPQATPFPPAPEASANGSTDDLPF